MNPRDLGLDRRNFLSHALLATSAATLTGGFSFAAEKQPTKFPICVFEKFLQDLSYDDLADTVAELGFSGVEATVRKGGHVPPERVEEDLPRMVEALKKRDLDVTIMTSDVLNPQQPLTEKVLRTAADLGIKHYRMGFYQYDLKQPIVPQLEEIRPGLQELAAFNKELGVTALPESLGCQIRRRDHLGSVLPDQGHSRRPGRLGVRHSPCHDRSGSLLARGLRRHQAPHRRDLRQRFPVEWPQGGAHAARQGTRRPGVF